MIEIYLLLAFLVSLGMLAGVILALIAPEELEPGVSWFIKAQDVLFLAMVFVLGYYHLSSMIVMLLIVFLIFYWYKEMVGRLASLVEYVLLGIFFGIGYFGNLFIIISSLIFLYCLVSGTILRYKHQHEKKIIAFVRLLPRMIYFLLGAVLPLLVANM
jgi:hypothetical protein